MVSQKNKVLVVGGAGYIGGLTVDVLTDQDHTVHVLDNLMYEPRFLKKVPFFNRDIRVTDELVHLCRTEKYDSIIWLAALVGDSACSADTTLTNEINYEALKRFVASTADLTYHMVFMSTCSVYGAQEGLLDEMSPTSPLSTYAITKLKSESVVKQRASHTIQRLGTVYGVGDPYSRLRLDLVVNVLVVNAIQEGSINIMGGQQWRPIISVRDVAGYTAEAAIRHIHGTYVLACENCTISEMGTRVANSIPGTTILNKPMKKEDERNYKVNTAKADQTYHYKCQQKIEHAVPEIAKLIQDNRIVDVTDETYHNGKFVRSKNWKERFETKTVREEPQQFQTGTYVDDRGTLGFCNGLDLTDVKRYYTVTNHNQFFIRAWHGHRKEAKYVMVLSGAIRLVLVRADKDMNMTKKLTTFYLDSSRIVYVPPLYYNGFQTLAKDTTVMFFSTTSVQESQGDDYRKAWDVLGVDVWDQLRYR